MNSLIHCIYSSAAVAPPDEDDLESLLAQSRRDNARRGITGMLLYTEGTFFQVLEGPAHAVHEVYAKIAADPRHERVTRIIVEPIRVRAFAQWTMGYASVSRAALRHIQGLNDFFLAGSCLTELDQGRARKLLQAFARGRWRTTAEPLQACAAAG